MSVQPAATWNLSGFGDEIDPDPHVQLDVLARLGASHIEVRSAWGINVIDLTGDQLDTLAGIISAAGFGVSAIASPVGKTEVSQPIEYELGRLESALRAAETLGSRYIRVFSFYPGENRGYPGENRGPDEKRGPHEVRDAVLRNMTRLAAMAEHHDVILLHENEKGIYGDIPERVLDLVKSVGSPHLRLAWDSANFVQVGVSPFVDGYEMLKPYMEYLQVKDAIASTGDVVPAGQGDGDIPRLVAALVADGYSGFASLEPHLASAHELGGFSGPRAFVDAAVAFRAICDEQRVALV